MPIYMDRHDVPGATAADVAHAHQEDLKIQEGFHCRALTYWFDEKRGTAFCLVEAPDATSVQEMHDSAHGLIPHQILEVENAVVESFLGRIADPEGIDWEEGKGGVISDSAFRAIMHVDIHLFLPPDSTQEGNSVTIEWTEMTRLLSEVCDRYGGRVVDRNVHGSLLSFVSPSQAVDCAHAMLDLLRIFGENKSTHFSRIRIGLSLGEPVTNIPELFGEAVQTARRLADIAAEGQLLVASSIGEIHGSNRDAGGDQTVSRYLTSDEESFLSRLMEATEDVWTDPNLQVLDFANRVGLSKSQLYRKIAALTGLSPSGFLREYRLRRAAERLAAQRASITAIAYDVGFGSLSYFTKCFKKRFGRLPSQYSCRVM